MASTTLSTAAPAQSTQDEQPKIKLYWLEKSRSQRILWLLESLSLPYELVVFHRNPKTHLAGPELKAIHPLGKSPVLSVTPPGGEAVIIAESANIVEYLLDHFGQNSTLLPKRWKDGQEGKVGGETEEWKRYRYFMHYAEGSFMGLMLVGIIATNIRKSPVPFFIRPITTTIASKIQDGYLAPAFSTHLSFLEQQLSTSPNGGSYLCGEHLTGADIMMSFPLIGARGRAGLMEEKYPLLFKYVERLEGEEGYLKAKDKIVEVEGKFEPMIKL